MCIRDSPACVYKTLVTQGNSKNYFVFVIPVAAELDLKAAARSVGEKSVAMIHVADINKVTGYVRGGCSPVGMKKQYTTVFDESVLSQPKVYVSGGRIGTQVCCVPADLIKAARASTAVSYTHLDVYKRQSENNVVELDDERKAAMVSNLLVVLCGNRDAQPIVNSGSLY